MPPGSVPEGQTVHAVLVTGNPHKVEELAAAAPGWRVEGLRLVDEPEETGGSLHGERADQGTGRASRGAAGCLGAR